MRTKLTKVEWPTLGLIIGSTILVLALSRYGNVISIWVSLPLLAVVLALHSSLQHEVLHGHPFKNTILNEATIFIPVGLFLPYRRFRDTHIQHHFDPNLTDPYDDPETNFLDPEVWARSGWLRRAVLTANNGLAGRMILGPLISFGPFYKKDLRLILAGDRRVLNAYLLHFVGLIPMLVWLTTFNTMPIWAYLAAAYGAISLLKIRTYLEHRAHLDTGARSVIIEDRGFLAVLFLYNNFHAVHHGLPNLAWYKLPQEYARHKDQYLQENDGYYYPNYRTIFVKYFFKNKDQVPHPIWTASKKFRK